MPYSNPENRYKANKRWRLSNPEKAKAAVERCRRKNPEKYRLIQAKRNHDPQVKQYKREHLRKQRQKYGYGPVHAIRVRIRKALQSKVKQASTIELLGCSSKEYKIYLAKLFLPGMSWENYGFYGWHIDHIKPISSFDVSTLTGQKAAFHYSNTQPLWALDNLIKGSKLKLTS